jgi:hyperosmotically inducible protein
MVTTSRTAQLVRRTLVSVGVATALSVCMAAGAAATGDPTAHSDSVGAAVTDTTITAKVKSSFLGDDRLKGSHIKVVTTNGVVTLTGSATSSDSKNAAEELAQSVNGVRSVDDQVLTPASGSGTHKAVASAERVGSDSWITTKVKSEITADSLSKGFDVHVKTLHGVVMLRGTLPNHDAIDHVKDIAGRVEHVKSVDTSELRSQS